MAESERARDHSAIPAVEQRRVSPLVFVVVNGSQAVIRVSEPAPEFLGGDLVSKPVDRLALPWNGRHVNGRQSGQVPIEAQWL
jgi:hypothetical protein